MGWKGAKQHNKILQYGSMYLVHTCSTAFKFHGAAPERDPHLGCAVMMGVE